MLPPLVHVKDNDNCDFWGFVSPYPHGDTHHFLLAPNSHMVSTQAEESQGAEQGWARTELGIIISAVFLPPLASVCLEFIIFCFCTHFISPTEPFLPELFLLVSIHSFFKKSSSLGSSDIACFVQGDQHTDSQCKSCLQSLAIQWLF